MATVLITGANRGLGLEFCKQYAEEGWTVLACARQPKQAQGLSALAEEYNGITILPLDVADFAQIDALASQLSNNPIDVLLNNAGVYGDSPASRFGHIDYQTWQETLRINTLAPVKMAEAFLSHLQRGQQKRIANVTSLMGSMTDNTSGGSLMYRSSKAGLNAVMKSLSIDLKPQGIGILILHPGWVLTDMGGPHALINPEVSVAGMRKVIAGFTMNQSGSFIKYDGSVMPW
jgi:NAD(P)-dependent dehydrogenase (short-subunit alcohol dehydrogenase family)